VLLGNPLAASLQHCSPEMPAIIFLDPFITRRKENKIKEVKLGWDVPLKLN